MYGPSNMSKDAKSLLLYLETRAVDHGGLLDERHMNDTDKTIVLGWQKQGFVEYGRICAADLGMRPGHTKVPTGNCGTWIKLSTEALALAHQERKNRMVRMWAARAWRTTEEYKNPKPDEDSGGLA